MKGYGGSRYISGGIGMSVTKRCIEERGSKVGEICAREFTDDPNLPPSGGQRRVQASGSASLRRLFWIVA